MKITADTPVDGYITQKQAVRVTGISNVTLWKNMKSGLLPYKRLHKIVYYKIDDLRKIENELKTNIHPVCSKVKKYDSFIKENKLYKRQEAISILGVSRLTFDRLGLKGKKLGILKVYTEQELKDVCNSYKYRNYICKANISNTDIKIRKIYYSINDLCVMYGLKYCQIIRMINKRRISYASKKPIKNRKICFVEDDLDINDGILRVYNKKNVERYNSDSCDYTVKELSDATGIKDYRITYLCRKHSIPCHKSYNNRYYFTNNEFADASMFLECLEGDK